VSYIQVCGVPRQVFAEETLVISTNRVTFNAANAAGALMIRGRLEGGPVRFLYLSHPTSTVGTPLYDSDVVEWTGSGAHTEIGALASTGGFIRAASSSADAILWVSYYR